MWLSNFKFKEFKWRLFFASYLEAIYLVSDEGAGIRAGHAKVMNDKLRQSDTYHGIAHNVGSWVGRLETAAYATIEK